MSTLAERQREFACSLFDQGRDADPGLAVYRASVAANFSSALAATYPVVRRLVGEAFFAEAAWRFALSHASTSGDLNEYGAHFPAFLAAYPHAAALAYLADVARLEWACHESESAPEAAAFDFEGLARIEPSGYGELRLLLHPSVRLLESAHPIVAIREANAPGRDGTPARLEGPDFVFVRRVDGRAVASSLGEREWRLLERIASGGTLEAALGGEPSGPALAAFVSQGIVVGFTAPACAR
jgi:hypothetical protein